MADDNSALCYRLRLALDSGEWQQAKQLIERLGDSEDDGLIGPSWGTPVPVGCYSILLSRLQGKHVARKLKGFNTESIAHEVAKWDSADLEAVMAKG
jgi:hypothetical protein